MHGSVLRIVLLGQTAVASALKVTPVQRTTTHTNILIMCLRLESSPDEVFRESRVSPKIGADVKFMHVSASGKRGSLIQ